ncbi:probable aminopeptidase NPEPL1 [Caerostris darwini]|uniref:Probable aminopeptidase NPEPL1 n=1 Tax=Caerostris darwini TaxID=1538125 RepID=A0AAV4UH90_9ARAC|nr:probable aminopeptidase NPEPL1 [Caerostris darwini]
MEIVVYNPVFFSFNMSKVQIKFSNSLTPSDPDKQSVLIFGKRQYLENLQYDEISIKFGTKVSKEHYHCALNQITSGILDSVPVYLKYVTLIKFNSKCSRYNTPTNCHQLTRLIKTHCTGQDEYIVILCEYKDVFASACAVARSYSLYCRKNSNASYTVTVEFIVVDQDDYTKHSFLSDADLDCLKAAKNAIRTAARIIDTPCNEMHTDAFLEEITLIGNSLGIKPVIIRGEELKQKGFGGLYNVGKAAEHPPALAILSHTVKDAKETIAWVGKGIVFDTGGLFIKSRSSMPGMKRDCGGAAGILGAFYVAVKMGFKENLHAIFCLAENSVGPLAMRPDDIITLYSGKTVEVNNTDAEGRLVLGDGVAYAKKDLGATTIVDMATLTGAQGVSTGRYHAAIITNDEECELETVKAGKLSGDLVHAMPYAPELHFVEFGSSFADMKNSVSDSSCGAVSCAGLFIGSHIGFDYEGKWLHIDMAKTSYHGEKATGYGVALLNTLFGYASDNPMLLKLAAQFKSDGVAEKNSTSAP